jgi:hypothetical protein
MGVKPGPCPWWENNRGWRKSQNMWLAGHVTRMWKLTNHLETDEERRRLWRLQINLRVTLKCKGVQWSHLVQDGVQWQTLTTMVINFWVPCDLVNSLNCSETINSLSSAPFPGSLHGVMLNWLQPRTILALPSPYCSLHHNKVLYMFCCFDQSSDSTYVEIWSSYRPKIA